MGLLQALGASPSPQVHQHAWLMARCHARWDLVISPHFTLLLSLFPAPQKASAARVSWCLEPSFKARWTWTPPLWRTFLTLWPRSWGLGAYGFAFCFAGERKSCQEFEWWSLVHSHYYLHQVKCPTEVKHPAEWWEGYLIFNWFYMQKNGKCEYNMQEQLLYFIICGRYFKIKKTLKKNLHTVNICYPFSNPLNPLIYSQVA